MTVAPGSLSPGQVWSEVLRVYLRQWPALLALGLLTQLVPALLYLAVDGTLSQLLVGLLNLFLLGLFTALVVRLAGEVETGTTVPLRAMVDAVVPVAIPVAVVSFLAALGQAVGLVLVIVPGLYLLTIWAVVVPVVVVERPGILGAFGRSAEYVRGNGWNVFAVVIVALLISIVADGIGRLVADAIGGDGAHFLTAWIFPAVGAPFTPLVAAVLFFTLRGPAPTQTPA